VFLKPLLQSAGSDYGHDATMTARRQATPRLPSKEVLVRFFGNREPVPVDLAARLLGVPPEWIRSRATGQGSLLSGDKLPWEDVMDWFLDVWPRDAVVARLQPDADAFLPRGLHLRTVHWRLPAYVITAFEVQAKLDARLQSDRHDRSVDGYVAAQLHNMIELFTVAALADDDEFLTAFHFPAPP